MITLGKRTPCTQSLTGTMGTMCKTLCFYTRFPLFSMFWPSLFFSQNKSNIRVLWWPWCQMAVFWPCSNANNESNKNNVVQVGVQALNQLDSSRCTVLLILLVACKETPDPKICSQLQQTDLDACFLDGFPFLLCPRPDLLILLWACFLREIQYDL